jgi:DNA polymerase
VQPQNYARPKIVGEVPGWEMEMACQLALDGALLMHVDNPMQILADIARGAICAPPGRKFCDADLAAIEGRKLPWLAGESWMLDYYRKLDRGEVKYDTYKLAYATVFGLNPDQVDKLQRQLGKVIELFAGYGGGVGALVTFAALFRQDPLQISRTAWEAGDPALLRDCSDSFDWFEEHKLTFGFSREVWTGLQYIVKAWRAKRPATVSYWKACQEAFTNAIKYPGQWFPAGRDTWVVNNLGANFVRLPSGRFLVYPQAHITNPGSSRPGMGFWGVSPFTKRWGLIYTHGARLAENWTQASSRDVLFHNIPQAEAEGYAVVMRIHDQLLTETPDDPRWSGQRLAQILRINPPWAPDLPLNAAGGEFRRFQK